MFQAVSRLLQKPIQNHYALEMHPMGTSRLVDGLIIPPTHLELLAVDHCNISCSNCNHASPLMPGWFADPDTVHRDFSILAKYYRPRFVKVLGGEPLLHKQLVEVIAAARMTGISEHFTLITNGLLLHKASDALWEAVDEVEISLYPGVAQAEQNIPLAMEKAETFGKKLTIFHYEQFRTTFSLQGSDDTALINRIFAACKIANVWGCHVVRDGYFHKCPQSVYTALLTGRSAATDRVPIVDSSAFQLSLLEYINSPVPLAACAHCVGTVGTQTTFGQVPRAQLTAEIDKTLEELVDFDWLERCLLEQDSCDDCKIPTRLGTPNFLANYPKLQRLLQRIWPRNKYRDYLTLAKKPSRQRTTEACRNHRT
jgi:GTP 3',8-cyclase